jgi:hypothetical protein
MIDRAKMRKACFTCVVSLFLLTPPGFGQAALEHPAATGISTRSPIIVIGFLGGFVRPDDLVHGTAQLGARLRSEYPSGVDVRLFENRHREKAHRAILQLLDTDHDGTLSFAEKENARIIIFGHSWGGSETVTLARELERENIPVLLTIQVDSVAKVGENDALIPANVAQAANFYQPDGILHGRPEIRAADPARTKVIGNFRFDYKTNPVRCDQYPLRDRILTKTHTEIECDPRVWTQVESLIRAELPAQGRGT